MSMERHVRYPAPMKALAKAHGLVLLAIDWRSAKGGGVEYQGPATEADLKIIREAFLKIVKLHEKEQHEHGE